AALRRAGGAVGDLPGAPDLVVDGLTGIGARGALRPPAAALAERVRGAGRADVVAVDLPSGVDADTGAVEGTAVRAALTVTFGTHKPGLLVGAGREHAGRVVLVDLGLTGSLPPAPVEQLEDADVADLLPAAHGESDKYTRGVVGVAAGSPQYTGAAVLAVGAAVRAGAGMVRFAGAAHAAERVRAAWPEVVVAEASGEDVVDAGRVQAWVVGPGLGTGATAVAAVRAVLAQEVPVLVDADALTVLAQEPSLLDGRTAPTLLTPHDREFARFGDDVGPDRVGAARRLAARLGVHVLLKGTATVVAGPDGPARVNGTGTPALATAGTGDVLSGGTGALLAGGLAALDAGSAGAHLHGLAGRLAAAGAPTSAGLVLQAWPDAVREVRGLR
ncbi:MAG TPA: NAD(P)H-hydrate dehydratase, partial [Mycobacteriales bacterium]|nr:NAD(P)H-hydrate dehydratase [Mycobacteriales bacterium]